MLAVVGNQVFGWVPVEGDETFKLNGLVVVERKG